MSSLKKDDIFSFFVFYDFHLMLKYTKPFLEKIELFLTTIGYKLRYEKGNFKAGYCVLKADKVIVINKYFT